MHSTNHTNYYPFICIVILRDLLYIIVASDDGFNMGLNGFWNGFISVWIRSPPPLDLPERAKITRLLLRV